MTGPFDDLPRAVLTKALEIAVSGIADTTNTEVMEVITMLIDAATGGRTQAVRASSLAQLDAAREALQGLGQGTPFDVAVKTAQTAIAKVAAEEALARASKH